LKSFIFAKIIKREGESIIDYWHALNIDSETIHTFLHVVVSRGRNGVLAICWADETAKAESEYVAEDAVGMLRFGKLASGGGGRFEDPGVDQFLHSLLLNPGHISIRDISNVPAVVNLDDEGGGEEAARRPEKEEEEE
jgi:hypothetical protein